MEGMDQEDREFIMQLTELTQNGKIAWQPYREDGWAVHSKDTSVFLDNPKALSMLSILYFLSPTPICRIIIINHSAYKCHDQPCVFHNLIKAVKEYWYKQVLNKIDP